MMSFQREYAESYDWLVEVFCDWAFTFFSSFLYYQNYDKLDENERNRNSSGRSAQFTALTVQKCAFNNNRAILHA